MSHCLLKQQEIPLFKFLSVSQIFFEIKKNIKKKEISQKKKKNKKKKIKNKKKKKKKKNFQNSKNSQLNQCECQKMSL